MSQPTACAPSLFFRTRYALRRIPSRARSWLRDALFRASMALTEDGGLVQHAKRELAAVGYRPDEKEEGPDKWIQQNLLDLLRVMSMQGHSGFSASYLVTSFAALARFQPMGPLTGEPGEWIDHGDGVLQNKRCGRVFKQPDRFNGQAYDIDGRVFREPNGSCFTNSDSFVPVTFPYVPKTEYVDVAASS